MKHLIENGTNKFYEKGGLYADSTFFDIFSFDLTEGNAKTALVNPYSIIITKQLSEKLFGKENPVGKIITFFDGDSKQNYKVTGLINNIRQILILLFHSLSLSQQIRRGGLITGRCTNSIATCYCTIM